MRKLKKSYIIIFTLVALSIICFSASYAFFTSINEEHGKLNIVVGTLDYKLESSNLKDNKITVSANTIEVIEILITSLNSVSSKYELYYNLNQSDIEDVIVGYSDDYDKASGEIGEFSNKNIKVFINNQSNQDVVVNFGIEGGLTNKELILSKGNQLVCDDIVPTIAINSSLPSSITKGDSYTILDSYTTSDLSGGSASCSSDIDGIVVDTSSLSTGTHIVTCTVTTGIGKTATISQTVEITYTAYTATNLIENGSFENGTDSWQKGTNATFSVLNSVATIVAPVGAWNTLIGTNYKIGDSSTHTHKFYILVSAKVPSTAYSYGFGQISLGGYVFAASGINYDSGKYTKNSSIINPSDYISASDFYFGLYHRLETETQEIIYIDYVLIVDLTETFGSGSEPNKNWCDKHINYFDGTTTIYK